MYVVLRSYITRLEAAERSRPEVQRRKVPTMEELAKAVGIHPVTLSNIASSNIKQLNLETGGRIISEMRRRGFPMAITDLVDYREQDEE